MLTRLAETLGEEANMTSRLADIARLMNRTATVNGTRPVDIHVTRDPAGDVLYVRFGDFTGRAANTIEVSDTVNADYNARGQLVGVEVFGLSGNEGK
jgi:uncharacterized protein YuzE